MPIQWDAVKRLGRLGVRLGAVAVLVALGVGLLLAGQAPSNNWLSFAKQAGAGGLVPGNSQTPVLRTSQRYGSIVTAGDTVYAGSENGTVYALRAADGTQQWQHVTGSQAGILAVRNDTVLVLTGNDGDQLLGLQASTGNLLWQRQLDNYAFGVAVDESTIYISGNTRASGNGSAIHAFAIRDGTPRWTYPYPGAMPNPIVLSGGLIFAHLDHNYGDTYVSLAALRASDGQLLWSHPYSQFQEFAGPAAGSGIVYITTNEVSGDRATALDLVAFDGATGRQVWRSTYPQDDAPTSGPVLADGTLYVDASASVYALRASDGTLLWRTSKSSGFPPPNLNLLVGGGAVYYPGDLGSIFALRASDGASLWQQHINNSVIAWMLGNGRLDVLTTLGSAYALRAGDGSLLWQQPYTYPRSGGLGAPPYALADSVLYVAGDNGRVQAMSDATGAVRWHFDPPPKAFSPEPVYTASVTFDASVAYTDALRAVTDLGLHTFGSVCQADWGPQGDASPWNHWLEVMATPLAPPGWLDPLAKIAGVTQVQPTPVWHCPLMGRATGPPHLSSEQAGQDMRVTFASVTDYGTALAVVENLGFRLSDPCYEKRPAGTSVQWTPMGQEQGFAATQSLLVTTTVGNATTWLQQIEQATGVTKVEVGVSPICG